jgi:hypothetical protein
MADMLQVQEQSRKSFFQWHILLVLKMKQLEATLADAGVMAEVTEEAEDSSALVASQELALLLELGFPVSDNLSEYDLPEREEISGVKFFFRAAPALDNEHNFVLDFVRQLVDGTYERREIMRVVYEDDDRAYLRTAASELNDALLSHSTDVVFNAAKVWSRFHSAVVMDWSPISSRLLGINSGSDDMWYEDLDDTDVEDISETGRKRKIRIDLNGKKGFLK